MNLQKRNESAIMTEWKYSFYATHELMTDNSCRFSQREVNQLLNTTLLQKLFIYLSRRMLLSSSSKFCHPATVNIQFSLMPFSQTVYQTCTLSDFQTKNDAAHITVSWGMLPGREEDFTNDMQQPMIGCIIYRSACISNVLPTRSLCQQVKLHMKHM